MFKLKKYVYYSESEYTFIDFLKMKYGKYFQYFEKCI